MSKTINNYKGRHHAWKQKRPVKSEVKRKGIRPTTMMWINFASKARVFMETRQNCRHLLGIKTLKGKKREKVLAQYFGIHAEVYGAS